jgi:UDP-2-acetamido-2,6-beta-L-arabino-hexul-4-ose reductase
MHAVGIDVIPLDRQDFADRGRLAAALQGVEVAVHAAGANRGTDDDIAATNIGLAELLATAVNDSGAHPHVIYLDTTHRDRSTAYGRSKQMAAEILGDGSSAFLDLVLPGVFGEHGRPHYNSVVSTFCHQMANGDELSINGDGELELVHAQDVADHIIDAMRTHRTGQWWLSGEKLTVTALAERLGAMHDSYSEGVVPPISDPFDRGLFNTLRSYRFPSAYPTVLEPKADHRGHLVELVKANTGGQMFASWTEPGVTRGNHYHRRKVERFLVLEGEATISLRRLFTDDVVTFHVSGREPVAVDMPTMHAHNITNVANGPLVTLFWADEIFDPERPDTVAEAV